jgi:hypothetical protein
MAKGKLQKQCKWHGQTLSRRGMTRFVSLLAQMVCANVADSVVSNESVDVFGRQVMNVTVIYWCWCGVGL